MAPLDPQNRSSSIPKYLKQRFSKTASTLSTLNNVDEDDNFDNDGFQIYLDFPLVQSMLRHEKIRYGYSFLNMSRIIEVLKCFLSFQGINILK